MSDGSEHVRTGGPPGRYVPRAVPDDVVLEQAWIDVHGTGSFVLRASCAPR